MSGYSFFNRTLVKASFLALCSCSLLLPNPQTAHAQSAQTTLHGSITYRERIALPPATVEVRLLDVSTPSAPPKVIASQQFTTEKQVPLPFQLTVNSSTLAAKRTYAVAATIFVNGQAWFKTPMPAPVNQRRNGNILLVLRRDGAERLPHTVTGSWQTDQIGETSLRDGSQTPTLELHDDGTVAGSTVCNQISGRFTSNAQNLKFGPIATTRRACMEATTVQREQAFLNALKTVATWTLSEKGDVLTLQNDAGQPLLVLHRQSHLPIR